MVALTTYIGQISITNDQAGAGMVNFLRSSWIIRSRAERRDVFDHTVIESDGGNSAFTLMLETELSRSATLMLSVSSSSAVWKLGSS